MDPIIIIGFGAQLLAGVIATVLEIREGGHPFRNTKNNTQRKNSNSQQPKPRKESRTRFEEIINKS